MSCFYQHDTIPFTAPYQETPRRGSVFQSCSPGSPPRTLAFVHLPAPYYPIPVPVPTPSSTSLKVDHFTGGTGRLIPSTSPSFPLPAHCPLHLYPPNTQKICTWGRLPKILFSWLKWRGGGMTKTTACVGEHCLRLRLEIFSGKTGFYTQWLWVWRKGAHIKRSAFMSTEQAVF